METSLIQHDIWCILGLPFDAITLQQSVNHLLKAMDDKERCFLSTPNLNFAIATNRGVIYVPPRIASKICS